MKQRKKQTRKNSPQLYIYKSQPKYPNAADHQYFAAKALNMMTALVSGMGMISAMLFLVTLA